MIIRQAIWRHGRRIAAPSLRLERRSYATATLDMLERSLQSSLQQTHQIETELQETTLDVAPKIANGELATQVPQERSVAELFKERRDTQRQTARLGTEVSPGYKPNKLLTNPPAPADVTLELLLASQAHLGHATGLWNPGNSRWIFGVRQGIHIIALEHTAANLRRACRVVEGVAEQAGLILFVGTRRGQARTVVTAARRAGGYHLFDRWRPGVITNRHNLLEGFKLKAVDPLDRPIDGLEEQLLSYVPPMPDLVVCLNPLENYVLLHECAIANIPTIGIIDTDANPTWVTYPIPANDDSLRCAQVVAGALSVAAATGRDRRLAQAAKGVVTHDTVDMNPKREYSPRRVR